MTRYQKQKIRHVPSFVKRLVAYRAKYSCEHCKQFPIKPTYEIDHKIPLFRHSTKLFQRMDMNGIDNLQLLCVSCHARKTSTEKLLFLTTKTTLFCPVCKNNVSIFFEHRCSK